MISYKENKKCKEGAKVQFCALVAVKRAQGLKCISRLAPSIRPSSSALQKKNEDQASNIVSKTTSIFS
jgi:hypothetical protein